MTTLSTTQTSTTTRIAAIATAPVPSFQLDASHSHVAFAVRHLMISNVRGEFTKLTGQAQFDPARPEETRLAVSIDAASISTREDKRDAHLRSADFFDVEQYPELVFVSKRTVAREDGLDVIGDLTIHGVTKEITLAVDEITPEHKDPWGNTRIGATARTKIRRSDFGMKWNAALETGGWLVGDEINIQIEAELIKQA